MSAAFNRLMSVVSRLRAEDGCPWDREQTHLSLKPFLIEEAYEVLDAINAGASEALCEELGDVAFQVLFHAQIAKETGQFDIDAVFDRTTEKMIRRHPHVFETSKSDSTDVPSLQSSDVLSQWERIKSREPDKEQRTSVLDGVPLSAPALFRAQQLQRRAARVGFDWKASEPVFEKILEELEELKIAVQKEGPERVASELGDLLFSIVNFSRFLKVDAEEALRGASARFSTRFKKIEQEVKKKGQLMKALSSDELETLWQWAKSFEIGETMPVTEGG